MHQQLTWNEEVDLFLKEIPQIDAHWEIYFFRRKSFSIEGKDLKVDKQKNAFKENFFIRVIKDKKPGFAFTTERNKIKEAFELALQFASVSDMDEFLDIPEPSQIEKVQVFDETLTKSVDKLAEYLIEMQKSAFFDKKIKKLRNAEINVIIDEKGIINSKGLNVYQPFTSITSHIIAIAEDKDSQMGWAYRAERFIKNMNFEKIGKEAGKKALMLLNPQKINPFKGMAVLDPYVASEFLELISQSLSAENYQMGKSIFIDKMGQSVINESLNILDDGLMNKRFGSTPFDAEGVPASRKILIEKGVLKSLMHNLYTSKRAGMGNSTGNAVRTERSITVGPTNLYIDRCGEKISPEKIIKFVDRGVYIIEVMGMHTANPVSGDFSVGISGIYIEKGELKYPVKETVISGNVLEVFKNIKAVGDDLTFFGNIGSPTLLVEGVDISG